MKHKRKKIILNSAVILILLVIALCAWPGYLFHKDYLSEANGDGSLATEPLAEDNGFFQLFEPQYPWLKEIWFVVSFPAEQQEDASLYFRLWKEDGECIFEQEILLQEITSVSYYAVLVNQWLDTSRKYCWGIEPINAGDSEIRLIYTEVTTHQAPENCGLYSKEREYGVGQALAQYKYAVHLDKIYIVSIYLGMIYLYIILEEIIHRFYSSKS